mmetsp:Transcript_10945/g.25428  ORF Transcript_10945/g.25428 Transcript_10945/m.25428 type:complete len:107 (-) Transcript_10945:7940-8260(-)
MFTFLVLLILVVSGLLILAVLAQNSKKEGLNNALGDMGASQLMGVKKTNNLLEQITWGLVITLFVLTLATSLFLSKEVSSDVTPSPNIHRAKGQDILSDVATSKQD